METAATEPVVAVGLATADFEAYDALLDLVRRAFAAHTGRIDPPSSAGRATAADLRAMADGGILVVASRSDSVAGCVFGTPRGDALCLSKLAVDPQWQGRGIGRDLVEALAAYARGAGYARVTLGVRLVLPENIALFETLGFVKTGETCHPGYAKPTSQDMALTL